MVGRRASLSRIARYLRGAQRVPLVVLGASGSGKTTLLAKASCEAMAEAGTKTRSLVVARFVGATPRSGSLAAFVGDSTPVPSDPEEVSSHFAANVMKLAAADRPLWLFLDGLEQLMGEAAGRELEWLPRRLPFHVKVVLSAGNAAKARWPRSVMTLAGLNAKEADELLTASLGEARRMLQPGQRTHVRARFARNGLPLYLKVAFEEVKDWKSWQGLPRSAAGKAGLHASLAGIVAALFQRLSQPSEHGPVLVRRVFALLAASRYGLAESEMVELLSADPRVMEDFIRRSPTERAKPTAERAKRLPWIVWSRLESDLGPYLLRRDVTEPRWQLSSTASSARRQAGCTSLQAGRSRRIARWRGISAAAPIPRAMALGREPMRAASPISPTTSRRAPRRRRCIGCSSTTDGWMRSCSASASRRCSRTSHGSRSSAAPRS
jgi:NACHT domain- and WD repeat-containing protein